ncbi:MAG: peptidoglycan DD-metalloendopeptidase family protein [Xanthomonadales bacterium]|nr:peptidoglycan DD-metalloendopeptidase family protein [Xanthomonadales bacterium]
MALVGARAAWPLLLVVSLLAGCAPWQPTPDRQSPSRPAADKRAVQAPPAWYRVQRGDTLYSIAFRYGLDWRKVAKWNGIGAPYTIRPGQELRLSAPPAPPSRPDESEQATQTPPPGSRSSSTSESSPSAPSESSGSSQSRADTPNGASASGNTRSVGGVAWQWPTEGRLARSFDPADTRKGIGVAGSPGQDVVAAAAGRVVYSGTALIGYGELIIVKHSDKLLSAYGHNRRRLVGEGDQVQRGQKIAEMGRNDRREEMLHFEIRLDGDPVNPLDYLPKK